MQIIWGFYAVTNVMQAAGVDMDEDKFKKKVELRKRKYEGNNAD